MEPEPKSLFKTLMEIDMSKHVTKKEIVAKKSGRKFTLSYVSWANAYKEIFDRYPDAEWEIHEFPLIVNGQVVPGADLPYLKTEVGYFVKVSLTIEGKKKTCLRPVIDSKNIAIQQPTSSDINDSIMRALVKCAGLHGLGLYLYAGEDIPFSDSDEPEPKPEPEPESKKQVDGNRQPYEDNDKTITEKQQRLLFARAEEAGWKQNELKEWLRKQYGAEQSADLKMKDFDRILEIVRTGTVPC